MSQDIVERFGVLIAEEADEYEADAAEAFERGERPDLWEREVTVPVAWLSEAASLITTLTAERDALAKALDRQCDNMAFIVNHVSLHAWYDKFKNELEQDRQALSRSEV